MKTSRHQPGRLADLVVANVLQLLAVGVPKRQIARDLHIGLTSVYRVARNERVAVLSYERCPGCGGKQKLPCRVCPLRAA